MTEKQLMPPRRTMAKAAMRISSSGMWSHDMKMGCRKYLANVRATAALLDKRRGGGKIDLR